MSKKGERIQVVTQVRSHLTGQIAAGARRRRRRLVLLVRVGARSGGRRREHREERGRRRGLHADERPRRQLGRGLQPLRERDAQEAPGRQHRRQRQHCRASAAARAARSWTPRTRSSCRTNGKFVFAVNAGSDTVTSFRETASGLKLVNQVSSGGDLPESLAAQRQPALRPQRRHREQQRDDRQHLRSALRRERPADALWGPRSRSPTRPRRTHSCGRARDRASSPTAR